MAIEQARAYCNACGRPVMATRPGIKAGDFHLLTALFVLGFILLFVIPFIGMVLVVVFFLTLPIALVVRHSRFKNRTWRCAICGLVVVPQADGSPGQARPASAKASQDWEKVVQKSRALPDAAPKSMDEIDRALDEKLGG